mmetsp:Transcript_33673/g.62564  ORF Transcript_33673/g.62564 Transcript_33673/m.62564 type:complete len:125 (-) Transcript_33673:499-873(-)
MLLAMVTLQGIIDYASGTEIVIWTTYAIGATGAGILVYVTYQVEQGYQQDLDEGHSRSAAVLAEAVKNLPSPLRNAYMNYTFHRSSRSTMNGGGKRARARRKREAAMLEDNEKGKALQRKMIDR